MKHDAAGIIRMDVYTTIGMAYVYLQPSKAGIAGVVAKSVEIAKGVVADYDVDGKLFGLELLEIG